MHKTTSTDISPHAKRKLGKSPVVVSSIIAGTWAIGGTRWGGSDPQAGFEAMLKSIELGIQTFDTAPMYGFGKSEELLGKIAKTVGRKNLVIATKCGLNWETAEGSNPLQSKGPDGKTVEVRNNLRPERILKECEDSLQRLGTDYIDIYLIHKPDYSTPIADSIGTLMTLQKQGKVRAIGVSNFDLPLLREAHLAGPIDCLQPRYSIISRDIEKEIIPFCRENAISIIGFSTQEKGLLTGSVSLNRKFPGDDVRNSSKQFSQENRMKVLEALELIRPLARFKGCSVGNLVVAWTIRQSGITASLVGARDPTQVKENAEALNLRLTPDEINEIEGAFYKFRPQP